MSPKHSPTPLPFVYPADAPLQEKLRLGSARVALTRLFERVTALVPIEFVGPDSTLLDVQVAIRECLSRDAPTLALLPEAVVSEPSGLVLSALARAYLGCPEEGYYSGLSGLPWVRVRIPDPAAGWADELWRAGARDFVFVEPSGVRVFAVIEDDHDKEITVVGAEAAELARRFATRDRGPAEPSATPDPARDIGSPDP